VLLIKIAGALMSREINTLRRLQISSSCRNLISPGIIKNENVFAEHESEKSLL